VYRPRILIVDDDPATRKFLQANLKADGYETLLAIDGDQALDVIEQELPDLVILDIMLPKIDGFELCQRLREWSEIPIIMLSARGDELDKVKCLNYGADDYVSKPFGISELMARVKAVFRRTKKTTVQVHPSFSCGDLRIDFVQREVTIAGNEVKLTPTEFALLQELVLNAGKVLTHAQLLNIVWGPEYMTERDYLHTFIRRLRAKIEREPTKPEYIISVPRVGYQLRTSTSTQ
jgi:two-component system KDP operon response regulator KdpE